MCIHVPAIPVKEPTRKSVPGRVHGENPQKCAHGPVFCTSEVTRARSFPNNPPMGQLLGLAMVYDYLRNKNIVWYKWKCRIYDKIVSILCLNGVLCMHAQGGLQTPRLVIFDTETHPSTKCYKLHLRLSLLAPPAEWQRSFLMPSRPSWSVVHPA